MFILITKLFIIQSVIFFPSLYLSICLFIWICLSVYMSICPYIHLSICPAVHISICTYCLSVYLSICRYVSVYTLHHDSICPSIYLSIPFYRIVYINLHICLNRWFSNKLHKDSMTRAPLRASPFPSSDPPPIECIWAPPLLYCTSWVSLKA